jgi:hypothetical protein
MSHHANRLGRGVAELTPPSRAGLVHSRSFADAEERGLRARASETAVGALSRTRGRGGPLYDLRGKLRQLAQILVAPARRLEGTD